MTVSCKTARTLSALLGTLVFGAVGLHVADASACSCSPAFGVRPTADDVVPVNTKIWIEGFCEAPRLLLGDDEIAVTMSEIENDAVTLRVLTPGDELEMGATYTVDCGPDSFNSTTSFTVTEEADLEAPAVPSATIVDVHESGGGLLGGVDSCGETEWAEMEVAHDGGILLLDVAGRASLDAAGHRGSVLDVFTHDASLFVGKRACDFNWSFDDDGEASDARWSSYDLAGNFSGWSAPEDVSTGCGCAVAGAPAAPHAGWLALGLALLVLRRRRD